MIECSSKLLPGWPHFRGQELPAWSTGSVFWSISFTTYVILTLTNFLVINLVLVLFMSAVVQFCDFVSVSWMVNLAGRAVSVLLDYVGQVSLCGKLTKILEKHKEWPHIQRTTGEL